MTRVRNELSSRLVSKQVLSPQQSLTSVFGMGTGGPSALKTRTMVHPQGFNPAMHSRSHLIKSQLLQLRPIKSVNEIGAPSGIRTRDPLIKSQLLYQLS